MAQKKKGFVSGKERHTTILDKAPVMNEKAGVVVQCCPDFECLDKKEVRCSRRDAR